MADDVVVSMSRFADFCASDALSQLAKVREIRRQYEQPYSLSADYWSRWREAVEAIHRRGGSKRDLPTVSFQAKDNRAPQYASACDGYARFWGRKSVEFVGTPEPATWRHGRLTVRVNPEWVLRVNRKRTVVKLHLKERLPLSQRLANPLLHLLETNFGRRDTTVGLLDVHRGRLWVPTRESRTLDSVLRMQAAAFLAGWDECDRGRGAA